MQSWVGYQYVLDGRKTSGCRHSSRVKGVDFDGKLTRCCLIQTGLTCSGKGKDNLVTWLRSGLGIWFVFDVPKGGLGNSTVVPKE